MKLFNNLESYARRIAVIEQNEKKYTYKDILKIEKKISEIVKKKDNNISIHLELLLIGRIHFVLMDYKEILMVIKV